MSDIFREVEEDLRHEHYKRLWDKYGSYMLGVAVLIVVATGGYRGWEAWQASQAENAGDRYVAALQSANEGELQSAEQALMALGADAPAGYAVLAKLRAASVKAQSGDAEAALKAFAEIAGDSSVKQSFRNAARIHAGYLLVDNGDLAQIKKQVSDLTETGQAWRHSARELMGLANYKSGDLDEARKWFQQAVDDRQAPANLANRSRLMLALIQGESKTTLPDASSSGGAATEGAKTNGGEQ